MKDAHLTLRLPAALARALARSARARGVPKSHLAREAVARYLAPAGPEPGEPTVRASDLARAWGSLPRLSATEASEFAADLLRDRDQLTAPGPAWE